MITNPGEGFRLLKWGEDIVEGDEYYRAVCGWQRTSDMGMKAGQANDLYYRRRITFMSDGWIKTSERLPTKEDANKDGQILVFDSGNQATINFKSLHRSPYWRKLPPDPVVEPQTADEAFNAEFETFHLALAQAGRGFYGQKEDLRRFWNAGIEWHKKQSQNQKPQ